MEIKDALGDELGDEPSNPEAVGIMMAGVDVESRDGPGPIGARP